MRPAPDALDRDRQSRGRPRPPRRPGSPRVSTRSPRVDLDVEVLALRRRRRPRGPGPRRVRPWSRRRGLRWRRHRVRARRASPRRPTACSASCPLGSGNDFARQLGIPRDDVTARRRPAPHRRRASQADLGRATPPTAPPRGSPPSPTPASTPRPTAGPTRVALDERHPALRAAAALRTLATYRPRRFRITVDDDARSRPRRGSSRWATPAPTRAAW